MAKILILGAGGVGGYFGGRLAEAGADVTFLLREKRQEMIKNHGLRIKSPAGDVTLPVKTVNKDQLDTEYDFIVLSCKAYDLDDSIAAIRPAIGDKTTIIPVLNGMAHLDQLNQLLDEEKIIAGSVLIQSTLAPDGVIYHFNKGAVIRVGAQKGGDDERAKSFVAAFAKAKGVTALAFTNIMQVLWEKWVPLATLAGMTCLMRANVGEILRAPGGTATMREFLQKNLAIAAHYGHEITGEQRNPDFLQGEYSTTTASMLRDIEYGAQVESEQILGDLLRRAQDAKIDHPLLALAYTHVKAYEERRKSGRDQK